MPSTTTETAFYYRRQGEQDLAPDSDRPTLHLPKQMRPITFGVGYPARTPRKYRLTWIRHYEEARS